MADDGAIFETDFIPLMGEVLTALGEFAEVEVEPTLGPHRPDLIFRSAESGWAIVEVKMRAPLTAARLDSAIQQLRSYATAWTPRRRAPVRLVLALPDSVLAPDRLAQIKDKRIEVWDRNRIFDLIARVPDASLSPAARQARASFLRHEGRRQKGDDASRLSRALRALNCGRSEWSLYQKLCADILTYLFCPPLEVPLVEASNATGVNRRDIILANYADGGFWDSLRRAYVADFIVVDAKNVCGAVTKGHVLQLANYLSHAGAGLFGMILTRGDQNRAALLTRREQWVMHRKMILVVSDSDLHQMIQNKVAGEPPEEVLRQQIQDFRLGM